MSQNQITATREWVQNGNIGIGTSSPNTSSILDVTSTDKGFLIPRMTTAQKEAIPSPAPSLMVFDTDTNVIETYDSFWGWTPVANRNDWMRKWGMEYWNDFGANNTFNDGVFTVAASNGGGTGITVNPFPTSIFIGLQGLRTGTNTNGNARIQSDVNFGRYTQFSNGQIEFETRIYIRSLSNSTDRFTILTGFNRFSSTSPTIIDGCTFIYDEGGVGTGNLASPNWQIVTAVSSVRSVFDTGVVVNTDTFYKFRIVTNPTATEVKYFINDTLVRTETSNIPTNSFALLPLVTITKSAGTTDVGILVDYVGLKKKFTTPR
jgi:hypothetical protein